MRCAEEALCHNLGQFKELSEVMTLAPIIARHRFDGPSLGLGIEAQKGWGVQARGRCQSVIVALKEPESVAVIRNLVQIVHPASGGVRSIPAPAFRSA